MADTRITLRIRNGELLVYIDTGAELLVEHVEIIPTGDIIRAYTGELI